MGKQMIRAGIRDQINGEQVEIIVEYPTVRVRWLETGLVSRGRIIKGKMILWDNGAYTMDEAALEHDVLLICCEAQLPWARRNRETPEDLEA